MDTLSRSLFNLLSTWLLVIFLLWPVYSSDRSLVSKDFESSCALRCPLQQNKTDENDIGCGTDCKTIQCSRGCHLWRKSLRSSCQSVCNSTKATIGPKELYCVVGCSDAVSQFFQQLREDIGIPPAPYLVPDTLTATSLSLAWDGVKFSDLSYLVQWRYEEHNGGWQYCHNQTWGARRVVFVENLQPYTKYRFRIALLLSPHSEPIVSEPSVVISTLPKGVPTTPPVITRATPIDSKRISVSWKPGPFPNGPIHSYIVELSGGQIYFKEDISAVENADFYMFQNLKSNTSYIISITMRNAVGEGPSATIEVVTPPEPEAKEMSQPTLILASKHRIIEQNADMMSPPVEILKNPTEILGIAIDIRKKIIFTSTSLGFVLKWSINFPEEGPKIVLTEDELNIRPFDLSVDWLNNHLYILGETNHEDGKAWQISRCTYNGKVLTVALAALMVKPSHIEVDPYNGYLFWVIEGNFRGGLYRLDLANISNGIKHEVLPDLVLDNPHLGAFVVDHTNFCILVPDLSKNTVYSMSLDGRKISDIRFNTQQPFFKKVTSLATANGLFYWTNGEEIFTEDFHEGQNIYFHNHYPGLVNQSYIQVYVNTPAFQPTPVPVNPPIQVQAVFGGNNAKISWQLPHLVGGQGKGAWQNWSFEVHVKNKESGELLIRSDIYNKTCTSILGLKENSEYVIRAQAYTDAGYGPWSKEFVGKTLEPAINGDYPKILWSGIEGLMISDATGEEVEMLTSPDNMQENGGSFHYVDSAWFQDVIYLVTNTSLLHWHNTTSHESGRLSHISGVGNVAVDWIGGKIYWSNSKQQLIFRRGMSDVYQEPLPVLTIAKELEIDSLNAFIYWSTGLGLECARLNGDQRAVYYPAQLFSGKRVIGLTLNYIDQSVYWIVQSSESNILFKAPLADGMDMRMEDRITEVAHFEYSIIQSPMSSFGSHFLWLRDNRNAIISDALGQYTATFKAYGMSNFYMIKAKDTYQRMDLNVSVIPSQVNVSSISIVGSWPDYNITWKKISNVNYGDVFYEITAINEFLETQDIVKENLLTYSKMVDVPPFTKIEISIRAFTYWGASPLVRTSLYTPQSRPSEPTNIRAFVLPGKDSRSILLRWNPPKQSNGLITEYKIVCWFVADLVQKPNDKCGNILVSSEKNELLVEQLEKNVTYYFQIQAFTIAGGGQISTPVLVNTSEIIPVPQLLFTTSQSVGIADTDANEVRLLTQDIRPLDITWNQADDTVYWINDMKEIMQINIDGKNKTKINDLNSTALSIAFDWIGRYIFWSELEEQNLHSLSSNIYRLDLSQFQNEGKTSIERIIRRSRRIHQLKIAPFIGRLFWVEVNRHGAGHLMTSNMDGSSMRPVFSVHITQGRRNCTCSENPRIGHTFALDQQNPTNPSIFYRDDSFGYIYRTDVTGCECERIQTFKNFTAIPSCLTSNHNNLYWSNEGEGKIFVSSVTSKNVTYMNLTGVEKITAIGHQLQPLPTKRCLTDIIADGHIKQLQSTSTSVTLELPQLKRPDGCDNISLPSVKYTVYYRRISEENSVPCEDDIINCEKRYTYHKVIRITNLKPFSTYIVKLTTENYYYKAMEQKENKNDGLALVKTGAGAPSPAQNLTAFSSNPNTIIVRWYPPKEFNDRGVSYEVHWKTEGLLGGVRQSGELTVEQPEEIDNLQRTERTTEVKKLIPGQLYQIWVRAYSVNSGEYSDTPSVDIKTLPHPSNITLIKASSNSLEVEWKQPQESIRNGYVEYYDFKSGGWQPANNDLAAGKNRFIVPDLLPKTTYLFRSVTMYLNSDKPYVWPTDARFTFETKGDRPSRPGMPIVQHLRRGVYQVTWDLSRENGGRIELYLLEAQMLEKWRRKRREANYSADNFPKKDDDWISLYNGTDNYWIITDLSPSLKYTFRVRAKNRYGWSDPSDASQFFDYTEAAILANQQEIGVVLGITLPIGMLICAVAITLFCWVYRKRDKEKKDMQVLTLSTSRGPDVELATLRELPQSTNILTNSNQLYNTMDHPLSENSLMLPHIRREEFKLTKFLGRGAFGEVYQGILQGQHQTKVAIKALRKGASQQEKIEFIKEAQLMSHFKHKHILEILGVCLDNDPNYIIMELMEGGDLLSYLRSNRRYINSSNRILLLDLLEICTDVAKGCCYLEEMHFVHRDLACRNCLVSTKDGTNRIVKIGDFGLARDIYKNDYYRKEGEGLLPVRWMAPESLVDGIFTSQSDVWSFGVLLWEIMTMGQQPYPARTNIEVLHYVREGGRLGRPINCSEELHSLMMKCWNFNPEQRPTFKYCLETLEIIKMNTANSPLASDNGGDYLEIKSDVREQELLSNAIIGQEAHKYLQLLYEDSSGRLESDGYEVPSLNIVAPISCDDNQNSAALENNVKHIPPDITTIEKLLNSDRFSVMVENDAKSEQT